MYMCVCMCTLLVLHGFHPLLHFSRQHLTEVPGRYVMHQGSLMQLSQDSLQPQQLMRAFLLNDSFMLAVIMKKR